MWDEQCKYVPHDAKPVIRAAITVLPLPFLTPWGTDTGFQGLESFQHIHTSQQKINYHPSKLMAPLSTEKYTMRKTGTLVSLTGRKQIQVDDWGTRHVRVPWQGNNSCKSTSRWEHTMLLSMLLSGAGWCCTGGCSRMGLTWAQQAPHTRETACLTAVSLLSKHLILQRVFMPSAWILKQPQVLFLIFDFHNDELLIFWKYIILLTGNQCLGQRVSTPGLFLLKGSLCP